MSADEFTASGDFRVGDVLRRAWRIFTDNLLFFLLPVLIFAVMLAAVGVIGSRTNLAGSDAWSVVAMIVLAIVAALAKSVILLGAFQRLRGEPLRVGTALRRASTRIMPLLVLASLWSLGLGLALALSRVPFGLGAPGGAMPLVGMLALPVALVPPVSLLVMWAVAVPACVVEGLSPLASMIRSVDLTKGHRWKIFGIMLPMGIAALASKPIELVVSLLSPVLAVVAEAAWLVVLVAYWHCAVIMIYHDLRAAKEDIDTGRVAAIFD
jgi:hypothetical protein